MADFNTTIDLTNIDLAKAVEKVAADFAHFAPPKDFIGVDKRGATVDDVVKRLENDIAGLQNDPLMQKMQELAAKYPQYGDAYKQPLDARVERLQNTKANLEAAADHHGVDVAQGEQQAPKIPNLRSGGAREV